MYKEKENYGIRSNGSVTHRCKEYERLHKELRAEYDQEIHRRILDDLIQNRGDLGSP